MSLFHHGRSADHQVVTHFRIRHEDGAALLTWETRGHHPHEVIVFRSYQGFVDDALDPTNDERQTLVYRGSEKTVSVQDANLQDSVLYYYTVFARGDDEAWHEQLKTKLRGQAGGWNAEDEPTTWEKEDTQGPGSPFDRAW
jgi:hypothetical protein